MCTIQKWRKIATVKKKSHPDVFIFRVSRNLPFPVKHAGRFRALFYSMFSFIFSLWCVYFFYIFSVHTQPFPFQCKRARIIFSSQNLPWHTKKKIRQWKRFEGWEVRSAFHMWNVSMCSTLWCETPLWVFM